MRIASKVFLFLGTFLIFHYDNVARAITKTGHLSYATSHISIVVEQNFLIKYKPGILNNIDVCVKSNVSNGELFDIIATNKTGSLYLRRNLSLSNAFCQTANEAASKYLIIEPSLL